MRPSALLLLFAVAGSALSDDYILGPDSQRQADVPQGTVTKQSWTSKIYPGTTRDYWVYVPAQYKRTYPFRKPSGKRWHRVAIGGARCVTSTSYSGCGHSDSAMGA